jgi:hypothetical protein
VQVTVASLFSSTANYYLTFANFFLPILKCIAKENTLSFELLESGFDTTPLMALSKKLKQIACALMLYKGPQSAAAAGAMVVCICP